MQMKEILDQLVEETKILRKSDSVIGYRERTQIERLLFLTIKQYCLAQINYNLGGLTFEHKKKLEEYITKVKPSEAHKEIIFEGFRLSELLGDLQAHDPYIREGAITELGGDRHFVAIRLADRIDILVAKIRKIIT